MDNQAPNVVPSSPTAPAPDTVASEPLYFLDDKGVSHAVPAPQASDADALGWKQVAPETAFHATAVNESKGSTLEAVKAGVESGARAVVPFEPSLEQNLGISSKENQRVRAEAHPLASTVGDIAAGTTAMGLGALAGPAGAIAASGAVGGIQNTNENDLGDKDVRCCR